MERIPFYAIKDSPVYESPLGLFSPEEDGELLEKSTAFHSAIYAASCRPGQRSG
ncbi:hypothetical protein HORIV_45990 [Vreelandella olivaria]|uniref:PrkA AAA domain-containing protein n=1 Tax=Vreelandella olivaria TaxID=390919 RepID=A0ABN5WYW0_9GAMM|nr:hypothetical protein HORIV_45990 [Halomonas olivaria]